MMLLSALPRPVFHDESDTVTLSGSWYVRQTDAHGLLLCCDGERDESNRRWIVQKRLGENVIEGVQLGGTRERVIKFDGTLDAAEMAMNGAPGEAIAKFRKGFPVDWETVWPRPPPPPPPPIRRSGRNRADDEDKMEQEPPQLRRSKRNENIEKPSYDEDDLLLRALRNEEEKDEIVELLGLREEDMESDDDDDDGSSNWTQEELCAFQQARLVLNPKAPDFWERLSTEFVKTRSIEECQERWLQDAASKGKLNEKKNTGFKGLSEEDAMDREERAAKMGTIKFRRQVRNDWERARQKDDGARNTLSTPFREKIQNENLPRSCCKGIFTPVATFEFGDKDPKKKKRRLSSIGEDDSDDDDDDDDELHEYNQKQQAQSPDVLVEVNRDNLDGYIINLVKQRQKISQLQKNAKNKEAKQRSKKPSILATSRHLPNTTTQLESDGVQATLTPGGTVKLQVDKDMYEDEYEKEERMRKLKIDDDDHDEDDDGW